MSTSQIRNKHRVEKFGEVLTSSKEVKNMLNLVESELERIDSKFLEPACGDGNFLSYILEQKLTTLNRKYRKNQYEFEKYSLLVFMSIYGIEILPDNLHKAKKRLFRQFLDLYVTNYKSDIKQKLLECIEYVLDINLILGDALTLKRVEDGAPIVFADWSMLENQVQRRDFEFQNLMGYEPFEDDTLFSDCGEPVILPKPIKDYPLVHFLEIVQKKMKDSNYDKTDILNCIAHLSSDEVFTTPEIAKSMLDTLPSKLWSNEKVKFLDPVSKTGVFLREIVTRLEKGLRKKIRDREQRVSHILQNQIYGIGITELTSLISRRTVYCSKNAKNKLSIAKFNNKEGNIKYIKAKHKWNKQNNCIYCGVTREFCDRNKILENYAYSFIHSSNPAKIFDMNFDVIVGNPPYQMSDGGAASSAKPIYQKFVENAIKLNPRYLTMIIPSRWFSGGKGLGSFRHNMLTDRRISKIVDYPNSANCFPGVEIKGGVCYFLWERNHKGKCEITNIVGDKKNSLKRSLLVDDFDFLIRYNKSIPIINKIRKFKEESFSNLVNSRNPYGFQTSFRGKRKSKNNNIKIYQNGGYGYISKSQITTGTENINKHKIFITKAYGAGEDFPHQILNIPFHGEKGSVCTETYIQIGPFTSKKECNNVISYIKTKLFRFLVMQIKNTQDASKNVYKLVPIQEFNTKITDEFLYKKYKLTKREIQFIDEMVRLMN